MGASLVLVLLLATPPSAAHGVDDDTQAFLEENEGMALVPFMTFGAEHMVTGYDHLMFLAGVIFLLHRMKDVVHYVTLFTIGHSTTLLLGVLGGIHANSYLVDAVIGLSVVYKGFDNLGGFQRVLGFQPNTRAAILIFGLFHGFGLATKVQEFSLSPDGLLANMLAFNVGVEIGQVLALVGILGAMALIRRSHHFRGWTIWVNTALMAGGFMLIGYQLTGFFVGGA